MWTAPRCAASLLGALLAIGAPARALAYDVVLDVPLHAGRGGPTVGALEAAVPSTITFRDATHADVAFRTPELELRGAVDLAEGAARVRSAQTLVLAGSPFRIEVEAGTSLPLVDGSRREVALESALPIDGLDLSRAHLRVVAEEATEHDAATLEPCAPTHLWAEPRVHGPVIRTAPNARMSLARPSGTAGWSEIWVTEGGVWLRGYTWTARHCLRGLGTLGTIGYGRTADAAPERQRLEAGARIASSPRAPWTVQVLQPMEVTISRRDAHAYLVFPLGEGVARIEGVLVP